jgi:hypothetical protein
MWWLPQTSGYLYLRVTMIWIDVHPAGENLTNMTSTLPTPVHVCLAYASYGQSPYVTTFCKVFNSDGQSQCFQGKGLSTQSPARRLTDPRVHTHFSPEPAIAAVGVKPPSVDNQILGLPDPYHRHTISTFNTCSRGPTHRSLTDTGGGYNLRGAGFPHTTPRPSQLGFSTFP